MSDKRSRDLEKAPTGPLKWSLCESAKWQDKIQTSHQFRSKMSEVWDEGN